MRPDTRIVLSERTSRRDFFRSALRSMTAGGIVALGAVLTVRAIRANVASCTPRDSSCHGCPHRMGCSLPRAKSYQPSKTGEAR